MEWAHPWAWLLFPLVVTAVWQWYRWQRQGIRYSDVRLFGGGVGRRAYAAVWGGVVLRLLAGTALVVAVAGPRQPDARTRLPAEGIAVMVLLDVSGSMNEPVVWSAEEPSVSRLEAARRAFLLFVFGGQSPDGGIFTPRPSDLVGLVAFAATPQTVCPLTLNHASVLRQQVERLEPRAGIDAGTNIGDAIAEGLLRSEAAGVRRKVLVLLSDGEHTYKTEQSLMPRQAAQLAANLGVPIYAVDVGGTLPPDADEQMRQNRAIGQQTLQDLAAMTGGRYLQAQDGAGLRDAFRQIDTWERSPLQSYVYRRYHEHYVWAAVIAIGVLICLQVLEATVWRSLP